MLPQTTLTYHSEVLCVAVYQFSGILSVTTLLMYSCKLMQNKKRPQKQFHLHMRTDESMPVLSTVSRSRKKVAVCHSSSYFCFFLLGYSLLQSSSTFTWVELLASLHTSDLTLNSVSLSAQHCRINPALTDKNGRAEAVLVLGGTLV